MQQAREVNSRACCYFVNFIKMSSTPSVHFFEILACYDIQVGTER